MISGRYFRLVALSEVNGNPWASAAEFSLTGCVDSQTGLNAVKGMESISAFPVPCNGFVSVILPSEKNLQYRVFSASGQLIREGNTGNASGSVLFDLSGETPGLYFILLKAVSGVTYRVKVIKE